MSICINGGQPAVGNSLNMLTFKYIFCKNFLISSTFNKVYTNMKSVDVNNEQDCVTAGNIIDLVYIRDHCCISKVTRSDVQFMIDFFMSQLIINYIRIFSNSFLICV